MRCTRDTNEPRGQHLLWSLPLGISSAIAGGLWLAFQIPEDLGPLVMGGVMVALVFWIATSILWPARADRTCPQCSEKSLERADPDAAEGLVCSACGWKDATQSAWFLAEEEMDCLEELSLRRRAQRAAGDGPTPRAVLEEQLP